MGLALSESQPWLRRVVTHLTDSRGVSLPVVVRRRHRLADLLRTKIADHGRRQTRRATDWLIDNRPEAIRTSDEHAVLIEEQDYAPSQLFGPTHRSKHHAFDLIFDMNGEELMCELISTATRTLPGGYAIPNTRRRAGFGCRNLRQVLP